jgi:hypothetical protein
MRDCNLERLILITHKEVRRYESIELYHVLRDQNSQENLPANESSHLEVGNLRIKGGISIAHIPQFVFWFS